MEKYKKLLKPIIIVLLGALGILQEIFLGGFLSFLLFILIVGLEVGLNYEEVKKGLQDFIENFKNESV
jgi:hypothetical protein